jgi:hypothetical protein
MKRNLDQVMTDLDGKDFQDKATLKTIVFNALASPMQEDSSMSIDKKMKQYALLQTINKGGEVELTAEDISLIKERGCKIFPLIVFGRMVEMLEQDNKE